MKTPKFLLISLFLLLILAACGGSEPASEPNVSDSTESTAVEEVVTEPEVDASMEEEMMDDESMDEDEHMDEEMMEDESMDEEMMDDESMDEEMMMDGPEWLSLTIEDARTGETFTFADFSGQTVYVEPMATWCTNCRRQLNTISEGQAQIPEDVVLIGLSVEPNLANDVLAGYANNQGYNFLFAVATPELVEALVGEYGRTVTNPPSTPHFIIRPDGTVSELSTGFHTVEEIVTQLEMESQ